MIVKSVGLSSGGTLATGSCNIYLGALVSGDPDESYPMRLGWVGAQTRVFIAGVHESPRCRADRHVPAGAPGQHNDGTASALVIALYRRVQ